MGYETEEKYVVIKITRKSIARTRRIQVAGNIPKHTTELDMMVINPFFNPPRCVIISSEIKNKSDKVQILNVLEDLQIPRRTEFYDALRELYYIISISLSILLMNDALCQNNHTCVTYKYYFKRRCFIKVMD